MLRRPPTSAPAPSAINASMATVTGMATTDSNVRATY
jgi:hypothetical protein